MRTLLFFTLLIMLFLQGCSSPYRNVKPHESLWGPYLSYQAPDTTWQVVSEYENGNYYRYGGKNGDINQAPYIYKNVPGSTYHIKVYTQPFKVSPHEILFDKNGDYEAGYEAIKNDPEHRAIHKEQNINYDEYETQYVLGMKCWGTVFARGAKGMMAGQKYYSITCGYYDKDEGKRRLRIEYSYIYAGENLRLQQDSGLKTNELLTHEQVERELKDAVKSIVGSLEIKNFDYEKMRREGLLHPNKPFVSTKW